MASAKSDDSPDLPHAYALGVLRHTAAAARSQLAHGLAEEAARTLADGERLAGEVLARGRVLAPCVACGEPQELGAAWCTVCGQPLPPY